MSGGLTITEVTYPAGTSIKALDWAGGPFITLSQEQWLALLAAVRRELRRA